MAIYTTLSKKDIGKIAEEFALGDLLSFTGMRTGSVNTHYLIETKRGKFFLKIDEIKSEVEAKQEIDLLLHLRKQNFPCIQPLKPKVADFIWTSRENASLSLDTSREWSCQSSRLIPHT